ncbi:uncharacterized protein At1g24485-like [Arachis duranensis]|uniref:Uncharacterized protein At1g24485-like n=1 Tax=Arachis duranensis TaxID=130453 RepID=A0A9C6WJ93_ARADU|nr:uncharacterized protein At1g24485-like [Arachis duranensis]
MTSTLHLFIALCVLLQLSPSSHATFVSIDCGSSESFTDQNNIRWVGDDSYIQHGVPQQVYLGSNDPLSTLRVFPNGKKHCYSIKVQEGEKVLARASFYYGNYDDKFSQPIFDLQFDGNYWATVNTSNYYYVDYEAIYVTKGNFTSICVAQTMPKMLPFISSLELRSLDPKMYSHVDSNHALILQWRYAFGGNQTIRYPDDMYDRIWRAADGIGLSEIHNQFSRIDMTTSEDVPPESALQNAIVSTSTNHYIQFINRLPSKKQVPVYITTYFSELIPTAVGNRSFQMYIDNNKFSTPIVPPFGQVKELYVTNVTASSDTSFVLQATQTSTLPPLINALEVYTISNALTAGTDSRDVEGLLQLQFAFEVLVEWSGDPCLPYPYSWDWIQCTTDPTPRVIALYLSGFDLRGELPDFSSMDALETIDLHNNTIEGPIPDFLGLLPKLKTLNLSHNRFNGSIPSSLKNTKIEIDTTNNCLSGMKCPLLFDTQPPPPPPPPQLFSGDETNSPPPPLLLSGDEPSGNGSMKRDLSLIR